MTSSHWTDDRAGTYYVCDERLMIKEELRRRPDDWPSLKVGQAQEEVLETLLVLNLEKLLDDDVRFLFRAGDYWRLQDITGVDPLGRIHLFELKRDAINGAVTKQLSAYLLSSMFEDARAYARRMLALNEELLTRERWKLYLTAALANVRTANIGRDFVNKNLPASYTKGQWSALKSSDKRLQLLAAIRSRSQRRGVKLLNDKELMEWATDVQLRTKASLPPQLPLRVRSAGVIWLVGRSFNEEALRQVREWRSAGLDARMLLVDARQSEEDRLWNLRVVKEDFPERRALVHCVAEDLQEMEADTKSQRAADPGAPELVLSLYQEKHPSSRDSPRLGALLRAQARARLYAPMTGELMGEWAPTGRLL